MDISKAAVGDKVWFSEEKRPYTVRARSMRFLVCTKPFNLRHTTIYTIADLEENIRGPENLIFGFGAESDEDCEEMVERLESTGPCKTEVSHRNRIPLSVCRVSAPIKANQQPTGDDTKDRRK